MRRTLPALLCLLLLAPAAAHAASTTQILRDCEDDGVLEGTYTPGELAKARRSLPTDIAEYSDCVDVLARAASSGAAQRGSAGGGPGGSGTGGGTAGGLPGVRSATAGVDTGNGIDPGSLVPPASEADHAIVAAAAAKGAPAPTRIGGRPVIPGTAGLTADATRNSLPTTLLVVVVLLAAAALAAVLPAVRSRVLARRRA